MIAFVGCGTTQRTNKEVTEQYFYARNAMDFPMINSLISDSITVIEGDYTMPYSKESFYEVFKWDSVFQTSYDIINLQEEQERIIASIRLSSIRNRFLYNDTMTCQFRLTFKEDKISTIESLDCENANWEVWQERVTELVEWIDSNHPELNGFIFDLTMGGAKDYIEAIQLFKSN